MKSIRLGLERIAHGQCGMHTKILKPRILSQMGSAGLCEFHVCRMLKNMSRRHFHLSRSKLSRLLLLLLLPRMQLLPTKVPSQRRRQNKHQVCLQTIHLNTVGTMCDVPGSWTDCISYVLSNVTPARITQVSSLDWLKWSEEVSNPIIT